MAMIIVLILKDMNEKLDYYILIITKIKRSKMIISIGEKAMLNMRFVMTLFHTLIKEVADLGLNQDV